MKLSKNFTMAEFTKSQTAERKGIDAAALAGSGPAGRVIERDVQAALTAQPKLTPVAKAMVADGLVQVDGQTELRKTCKLRPGQVVTLGTARISTCAPAPSIRARSSKVNIRPRMRSAAQPLPRPDRPPVQPAR